MAIFPPLNVFAKSPRQMRREAEGRDTPTLPRKPCPPKLSKIDPEARPLLDGANFAAWLAPAASTPNFTQKGRAPSEVREISGAR